MEKQVLILAWAWKTVVTEPAARRCSASHAHRVRRPLWRTRRHSPRGHLRSDV